MKKSTSMKICKNFKKVFRAGYCDLQSIFSRDDFQYYNSGVYGWNCDLFCDYGNDLIITTGYRNMRGLLIPEELIKEYSENAKKIRENWRNPNMRDELYNNRVAFLNALANL